MLLATLMATLATAAPDAAQPKVAVVYSAWGEFAFRDIYDGHFAALGWPVAKFQNTQVADLAARLAEFEIVLAAGVANLESTQDMAPYREAFLGFLNRGGLLCITDASYPSVLDQWVERLGPEYALTSAGCAPYTKEHGGSSAITCDPADAVAQVPNPLAEALPAVPGIWAHLEAWGPAYRSLVTCADGKSLLLWAGVGQGAIAVTSYCQFQGDAVRGPFTQLMENLWLHARTRRAGLAATRFSTGPALPGPRDVELSVQNTSQAAAELGVALKLTAGADVRASCDETLRLQPGQAGDLRLPVTLDRGEQRVEVTVAPAGGEAIIFGRTLVVPPAIDLKLACRHIAEPRTELALSLAVCPGPGVDLDECSAELLVDGRPESRVRAAEASSLSSVPVGRVAPGTHRVAARVTRRGEVVYSTEAEFVKHPLPRVYATAGGPIMVEGRPFLPMGWYHVSWPFSSEERLAFLRDIAEGGFNVVHAGIKDIDEWEPFLAEAQKLGVKVVTEFAVDPLPVLERYKSSPAVLAWNLGDEPDGGGIPPEEMAARHDRYKAVDADHPTYQVLCVPDTYARYVHCADLIAPDPYPIHQPDSPTWPAYEAWLAARDAAQAYEHPIIAVPQCFGYANGSWVVPSPAQCRNMTYLALAAGAKGLIYYTYADPGFRVPEHPELWEAMKALRREVAAIEPDLLNGGWQRLETGQADVAAASFSRLGRTLVIAVNASGTEARDVTLRLPSGRATKVSDAIPGLASGMALVEGGRLSVHLEPLAVGIGAVLTRRY